MDTEHNIKSEKLQRLDELVPLYGQNKEVYDKYDKLCEASKQEIKDIMGSLAIQNYTVDGYTVRRVVQEKESINEDMLLEIIKRIAPGSDIIKTKEYVDMEALEAAIYHDELSKDDLFEIQKAKKVNFVIQLRLTKARKRKGEE